MDEQPAPPESSSPDNAVGDVDDALARLGDIRKSTPQEDPSTSLWNRNFVLGLVGVLLLGGVGLWLILLSGPHGTASDSLDCPSFMITVHGDPESFFIAEGCGRAQPFRCNEKGCFPSDDPREAGEDCCGDGTGWRAVPAGQ